MLRLTKEAVATGQVSPELELARSETLPTFTHFLDLPLLMVIVSLGATRPDSWRVFFVGTVVAVFVAIVLTVALPRIYPWIPADRARAAGRGPGSSLES
jgi:hypothetical protein